MCERAGLSGLLIHDLRRTAVRNMIRARIPEKQAMRISGHRSRNIFDRYDIVDERDVQLAGQKLAVYLEESSKLVTSKAMVVTSSLCKRISLGFTFLLTKPSVESALPTEGQNDSGLLSSSAGGPIFAKHCAVPNTTASSPLLHLEMNRAS